MTLRKQLAGVIITTLFRTLKRIMNSADNVVKESCRTCLSCFDKSNGKCSLIKCLAINSDSGRLELMKNIMTTCSVTLFSNKDQEEVFICMSCVMEIDQMLNFLEKCIYSDTVLRQALEMKTEKTPVLIDDCQAESENGLEPKVQIKVEDSTQDQSNLWLNHFNPNSLSLGHSLKESNSGDQSNEYKECHKKFQSVLSLTYLNYKHSRFKAHICVICEKNFQTLQLIKKHMAAEHNSTSHQQLLCRRCSKAFTSKHHLSLHEINNHRAKKYSCSVCKRTFATVSSLKFHKNIHPEQQSYLCNLCPKSFVSPSVLREHKKSFHSDVKLFQCDCGKSFNRKRKLQLHVEFVHEKKEKSRKYSCPDCDKKFYHPYSLKNHSNSHLGIKPFLCNACGSAFTALSNLTSHLRRIHSGDKPPSIRKYLCHTCGDSFTRAAHLQRHILRKHVPNAEKKHECPICKKKFLEKSDVTGHMKMHDDLKPFVCEECSKCFRTAWRLQAHVKRVHLGLRPFECVTCCLKFKTKSHLEKHIRTHTGEKPFSCPHCSYTCAEKSNLKKHINIHFKTI